MGNNKNTAGLANLNHWTTTATAFPTWMHLVAACRAGYVPTVRHERLRAALVGAGCRVF